MKLKKEVKIGITILIALSALFYGYNYLRGLDLFKKGDNYHIKFSNISGLTSSTPIKFQGLVVGIVTGIDVVETKEGFDFIANALIQNQQIKITKKTNFKIEVDFFGSAILDMSYDGYTADICTEKDTLIGSVKPSMLDELGKKIDPLSVEAQSLIKNLNETMRKIQQKDGALSKFEYMAQSIGDVAAQNQQSIKEMLIHFKKIAANIDNNQSNINSIITNLKSISDTVNNLNLAKTKQELDENLVQLSSLMKKVQDGKGSIGKLLNSDSLHTELVLTAKAAKSLIDNIEAHPKRYINFSMFGGNEKGMILTKEEEDRLMKLINTVE